MTGDLVINILLVGLFAVYMMLIPNTLHMIQLESYHTKEYWNWMIKNGKKVFKPGAIQLIIFILAMLVVWIAIKILPNSSSLLVTWICYGFLYLAFLIPNVIEIVRSKQERKQAKKPLKYTARAKRLFFSNIIILILLRALLMDYLGSELTSLILAYSFLIFTLPANMVLSNIFISPTEDAINQHYINSARRKLNKKEYKNLIRIGITGSYGKTSTKYILQTILSEKYHVLATPESYNTTMGNVRTIREQLTPEHEVFISEMGARKRYDIQEICSFVRPQIGIITSIGQQHLETFKTIETVAKTKGELLDGLTFDGVAFLPKENQYCLALYQKEKHEKYLYGMDAKGNPDVYVTDIHLSAQGSTFTIVTKQEKFSCTTKLLGEHNVQNIVGCVAIALYLGLSKEEIVRGIAKVEAVPHRLQILPSANGTIVIDDAFNSNPVGSKMALEVIKQFDGRKIIITPGMVELGEKEYELNKEFGRAMAESVDIAILVGIKRSKPLEEGLREKKFEENNIYVVNSLDEATKRLANITKAGDVVLFENDLPDNYNE